jgi:hypothetical protein
MNYNTINNTICQEGVCVKFSDYITIKEASEKWGVGTRQITYQVVAGRIPGAMKKGNLWLLPMSAKKPEDLRKYNKRQPPRRKTEEPS